jgi:signal peptidase I
MKTMAKTKFRRLAWLAGMGCGLLLVVTLFRLHYCLVIVSGESMQPTLESGDLLVVDKRAYKRNNPCRGDMVIARHEHELIVKRIVGLPGEEVEVKAGILYVNGEPVTETCTTNSLIFNVGKGRLFDGRFATLGDNRAISPMQAVHPIVSKEQILGRVAFSARLWPGHHG